VCTVVHCGVAACDTDLSLAGWPGSKPLTDSPQEPALGPLLALDVPGILQPGKLAVRRRAAQPRHRQHAERGVHHALLVGEAQRPQHGL
jgi:hypothetical protein